MHRFGTVFRQGAALPSWDTDWTPKHGLSDDAPALPTLLGAAVLRAGAVVVFRKSADAVTAETLGLAVLRTDEVFGEHADAVSAPHEAIHRTGEGHFSPGADAVSASAAVGLAALGRFELCAEAVSAEASDAAIRRTALGIFAGGAHAVTASTRSAIPGARARIFSGTAQTVPAPTGLSAIPRARQRVFAR